ncbi:MAG: hypothetical protein RI556_06495 [Hydrogenovibrio sp.]|uniref:hypothetical protein n=1 Tax=Hydrogenovibrio sp. TaxID=2065821 RepID=UPI002870567E|nr:hypothetical protein [Hydrogenovibrio sp.]MDR9498808.1 hypothetical protein [Hydrogenovibrio sp.]
MSDVTLKKRPKQVIWHLKDSEAEEALEKRLNLVLGIFSYRSLTQPTSLVARLGSDEYFVCGASSDQMETIKDIRAFQRGDAVFELSGNWLAPLSEICIHDFRQTRPGHFLMTTAAGVNVWLLIPDANAPLIMGCDPTYEAYLYSVLERHTRPLTSKEGV